MRILAVVFLVLGMALFGACVSRVMMLPGGDAVPGASRTDCAQSGLAASEISEGRLAASAVSPDRTTIGGTISICVYNVVSPAEEARRATEQARRNAEADDARAELAVAERALQQARKAQADAAGGSDDAIGKAADRVKAASEREAKSRATALRLEARSADAAKAKLAIFLNGVKYPRTIDVDRVTAPRAYSVKLAIPEDASTDLATFWREVLAGGASWDSSLKGRTVGQWAADAWTIKYAFKDLSVGLAPAGVDAPETTGEPTLKLGVYEHMAIILGLIAFLAITISIMLFAASSTLIRDNAKPDGSFSLGRTQMLFWFVLTTAGFLFLWLTIGQYNSIMTASVLGLLGISGVTGLASVAIDSQKSPDRKSTNFFADLVGDADGPKLQRLQAIAWTLILGVIFAYNVIWNFKFVEFGTELLLLMTFVNGLYLGFKPQEKGS